MVRASAASGIQWHKLSYYVWTHPKNVDSSKPARTIICWHGLARNAHDFDILAQYLVKNIPNATVVCPDGAGRGESEKLVVPAFYNIQQYSVHFLAIWNAIGSPDRLEWVGISMGGLLGMLLCAAHINCPIQKMVIIDIGPFVPASSLSRISEYVGKNPLFETFEKAEEYVKQTYGLMGKDITEDQWQWATRFLTKKVADGYRLHYDPAIAEVFFGPQIKDIDLWVMWDLIRTPIMVYHGELSDLLTKEIVSQMQSRGPKVDKLVSFPDCGHTPHLFNLAHCQPIIDWLQ